MIEHVETADDPRLGEYRHVGYPEWLRAQGLFVAEGRLVVQRLVAQGRFRIRSILLTSAARQAFDLPGISAPVYVAPQSVLNGVTGFNFHRGCVALASRPEELAPDALVDGRRLLALEGIGNPDNVGGLFRVAAAFGVDGILLDRTTGDPFYRKAVRTSMGATLSVPFARDDRWPTVLESCRRRGFTVVALTPRESAVPLKSAALDRHARVVLMLGAEGPGLSDDAVGRADLQVRIPIAPAVDSLNVTVAAGIALAFLTD